MTVAELRAQLEGLDDDLLVVVPRDPQELFAGCVDAKVEPTVVWYADEEKKVLTSKLTLLVR